MYQSLKPGAAMPSDFLQLFFEGRDDCCADVGDLGSNLDFWVQAINVPRIRKYLNSLDEEFFGIFDRVADPRFLRNPQQTRHIAVMTMALVDGLMVRGILNPPTVDYKEQITFLKELFGAWLDKQPTTESVKK